MASFDEVIPPGQVGRVTAKIDTKEFRGPVDRSITLFTDDPDQPQVLNYLGYSWIDQDMHLERALEMIEKAVEAQPMDGYIIDSLGWAFYKLGRMEEAVETLERAVMLLPNDPEINDHLVCRVLSLVEEALRESGGDTPVAYCWLALGSEGRREQTLVTDQDNALVYADVPGREDAAAEYFPRLGERVCTWLKEVGVEYCDGDVMASNGEWCQPLSAWKEYFRKWVRVPEPEAVLNSSIFFDFREVHGDAALAAELRGHVAQLLAPRPGMFFNLLAQAVVDKELPVGLFGRISVETRGSREDVFDIKQPIARICELTRLQGLWHGVDRHHPLYKHPSAAEAARGLIALHRALDRMVGDLVQDAGDAAVVAFTMGGMGPNHSDVQSMVLLPELLYRHAFGRPLLTVPSAWTRAPNEPPLLGEDESWGTASNTWLPGATPK